MSLPPKVLPGDLITADLMNQIIDALSSPQSITLAANEISALAVAGQPAFGTDVQSQLGEIVKRLLALASQTAAAPGAALVGDAALGDSTNPATPKALAAGTLRDQLTQILGYVNTLFTQSVGNAATLQGHPASDFALASHNHDTTYLRRVFHAGPQLLKVTDPDHRWTTLPDQPGLVIMTYNVPDPSIAGGGFPLAESYVMGQFTPQITTWIKKIKANNVTTYELWTKNNATGSAPNGLYVSVAAYEITPS